LFNSHFGRAMRGLMENESLAVVGRHRRDEKH